MKIVVIVRTRDETKRIGKFCESYRDADVIIVSDGGSLDDTESIASSYPNVILKPFTERVELNNGYWRNNDAAHANHLIQEARKLDPDWIIYDDCDCRPNYLLKQDYRDILSTSTERVIMAVRVYHWNEDEWFPRFSSPTGQYEASLWAWRGDLNFSFIDNPPAYWFALNGEQVEKNDLRLAVGVKDLMPPYCLLHYSWNEETVEYKRKNYAESGFIRDFGDPREFAGKRSPIEEWMRE